MEINSILLSIVAIIGFSLIFALLLRQAKIPAAVAYIATGLLVGPSALGLVHDRELLDIMGELGVIMLLFFIGMEVSLPRLLAGWRVAVLGTMAQLTISVGVCSLGAWLIGWTWQAGLLYGFIISMSSTAVVLTLLKANDEMETTFGQNALGVLLMQDLAIVPIMIVLGSLGSEPVAMHQVLMQVVGGGLLMAGVVWLLRNPHWKIPLPLKTGIDQKIMLGLLLCFAAASLTAVIGLSAPFGAFLAGLLLRSSDQSHWVEEHLHSLYVVFVAIFFLSIGMLVDMHFVLDHLGILALLTLAVFILNSGINTIILRLLGESWRMSLLTGGLLSQIGELSFLLASLGMAQGILSDEGYHMAIVVIAMTLMLSPLWVLMVRRMVCEECAPLFNNRSVREDWQDAKEKLARLKERMQR
ncbi:MAG: cation:proton antiporter [Mariprofundaceae bacterium]|nr:cation:proton antiporter [Mariprofundaceae bacterium]